MTFEIENVSKTFAGKKVVDNVSFSLGYLLRCFKSSIIKKYIKHSGMPGAPLYVAIQN